MRGQAVWVVVLVLLQMLSCCCAFGGYPGTFYQMMLRLNKERKNARTAPSPSRLWAILNPAATLGSLSNIPLDSNRVVRRDLEPRQVQESTTQEPVEGSQPLNGESEPPNGETQPTSEGQEYTSGGSESTEPSNRGSEPTETASGGLEDSSGGSDEGSQPADEGLSEASETVTEASDVTNEDSEAITEESEPVTEKLEPTETTSEVSEPILSEESSGGLNEAAKPMTGGSSTISGGSEPTNGESNTTSGELEPSSSVSSSASGEGTRVGCGGELVMPSPPASLAPTQGFTFKQNLSTPGWGKEGYPEEMECVWSLKVGRECEVGLLLYQVLEGEVLQSSRCLRDYLEFVQPNSHATRYCGPLVNNRDKVSGIDSWHSSQDRTTTIRFRSTMPRSQEDHAASGTPRGFLMEVTYYCWLYNKEVMASTRENEVSGDGGHQHVGGRKEESGGNEWEGENEGSKGSVHESSGAESPI